jgi:hypothetical protein
VRKSAAASCSSTASASRSRRRDRRVREGTWRACSSRRSGAHRRGLPGLEVADKVRVKRALHRRRARLHRLRARRALISSNGGAAARSPSAGPRLPPRAPRRWRRVRRRRSAGEGCRWTTLAGRPQRRHRLGG